MAKTKKVTDQSALVTEGRLAVLLSRWAKAADAAFAAKLVTLKAELREEILTEMRAPVPSTSGLWLPESLKADAVANPAKYGIPTDSEGGE